MPNFTLSRHFITVFQIINPFRKPLLTGALLLVPFLLFSQSEKVLIDEISGDLDQDGVPEKVGVYNIALPDGSFERDIIISRQSGDEWTVLAESAKAVMASNLGAMKGDPYQGMEITDGVLLIHHYGGTPSVISMPWYGNYRWRAPDPSLRRHGLDLVDH